MTTRSPDALVDPDRFEDRVQFGAALTAVRERAGLSVREIARALRIPPATAGDYCSGRTLPPARMAPVLTGFLGLCGVHDSADVESWQRALLRLRHDCAVRPEPTPYPGFAGYDRHDARWFRGRDRLVAEVRSRVEDARHAGGAVAVVGPSGSGKSSLLRAGLLPSLRGWTSTALTPTRNPCRDLSDLLCHALSIDADDVDRALHTDHDALTHLLRAARRPEGLVVVVDQAEDLFRGRARHTFLSALAAVTAASGVVVLGLRSDTLAEARQCPLVASAAHVEVTPMTEPELREAIEAPAREAGRPLEPGLVELLLHDMAPRLATGAAHAPGALGLLSQSLLATWRHRRRGRVTIADHLATGGLHAAAAEARATLPGSCEDLLRAVVDGTWTGPRTDLEPLVRNRLLTTHHDGVTPAHESVALGRDRPRAMGGSRDAVWRQRENVGARP